MISGCFMGIFSPFILASPRPQETYSLLHVFDVILCSSALIKMNDATYVRVDSIVLCSRRDIFVNHIKAVSNIITTKYPHIKPLIWDDMLRNWPASSLADTNLNEYVEPVVWVYSSNIRTIVPLSFWYW